MEPQKFSSLSHEQVMAQAENKLRPGGTSVSFVGNGASCHSQRHWSTVGFEQLSVTVLGRINRFCFTPLLILAPACPDLLD